MKYRKKPVEVEAIRYDGTAPSATTIIEWAITAGQTIVFHCGDGEACRKQYHVLRIPTLEGTMSADPGDWVIKGVQGEFYPCKPDIFAATYEAVTDVA